MATPTYDLLDSTTLSSSASSVSFTSIDQSYRDLVLVMTKKGDFYSNYNQLQLNGDTGSNYNYVEMYAGNDNGFVVEPASSATSNNTYLSLGVAGVQTLGLEFSTAFIQFLDYSATDKHKTALIRNGSIDSTRSSIYAIAGRWASNSAITSISLFNGSSRPFDTGSTFSLYGIAG